MDNLTKKLESVLRREGAELVGFADLGGLDYDGMARGAAVAVALPAHIVQDLLEGPTKAYYYLYQELNARLNRIVTAGAAFLQQAGYKAFAQTTDTVPYQNDWATVLPHKTVATRAGLGWIGKSCLLVTPEFGSALRLSSLLTDAPLACGTPIEESRCGGCRVCVDACPGGALKGRLWSPAVLRDAMVEKEACRETQLRVMKARTGLDTDLCGKCFAVCPYTRRTVEARRQEA